MNLTAIPTRDRFDLLAPLLTQLVSEPTPDLVLVMDNGYSIENRKSLDTWAGAEPKIMVADCHGQSIYQMWNFAIDYANEMEAGNLCLLNDDVSVSPGMVRKLATALLLNPGVWALSPDYRPGHGNSEYVDIVHGTFSSHGLAGFAFMFDPQRPLRFDENYGHWYGDDDFVNLIETQGGKVGILNGVRIEHVGGATASNYPDLAEVVEADRRYFEAKWR